MAGGFGSGSVRAGEVNWSAVTVWHPDGLDGFAVSHTDEITLGAVDRGGGPDNLREADDVAALGKSLAEAGGERGDVVERCGALAVEGLGELVGAEAGLAELSQQAREIGFGLAEEGCGSGFEVVCGAHQVLRFCVCLLLTSDQF